MIKKGSKYALIAPIVGGLTLTCFAFDGLAAEQSKQGNVRTEQASAEVRYNFSISAGTLQSAIDAIKNITGVTVIAHSDLVGKQTASLAGHYTAAEALQKVLQEHALQLQQTATGSYTIVTPTAVNTVQLPSALILATADNPDVKVFDQLDMRTSLRNDLAEALAMVPSVRVSDTASSSLQQGDLKPAEFSIRGAEFYQNKIMLDGASIDNMLDPANKESESNYTSVAGHSQSVFIDPRFVKNLKVIDVNASAAEGGFTGGVVKAETQSYNGYNTFDISQRRTQDSWTNFHVDEDDLNEFNDGAAQSPTGLPGEFQPNFKKSETALSGATRIGDLGVFMGYSEKQAQIKQKQLVQLDFDHFFETGSLFKPGEEKSLDRHSRYAVIRTDLLERDYDLNASLAYSDYSEDSFLVNYLDSDFSGKHNGLNLSINFAQMLGETKMDLNINAGTSADEREFDRNILDQYRNASLYGEGVIGGYGELANNQHSFGSTLSFSTLINDELKFNYGGEFKWSAYKQDRANDFIYNEYKMDFTQVPLPPQTSPGNWAPEDHFHSSETIYGKGKINFKNLNLTSYAELEGEHDRFFWRGGLRLERDDWLKNTNLAPRLLLGVYLDENKAYQATLGANRYYGKSFLSYRLREKELRYKTKREYDKFNEIWNDVDVSKEWQFRDLATPYDEEYSFGLYGPAFFGDLGFQVVQRRGRKQIRQKTDEITGVKSFDNSGSSETYQVDLFWRSKSIPLAGAYWTINTALAWMDKETDNQMRDKSSGYTSTEDPDMDVIYKGKRISRGDLPGGDFATPITASLDLITQAFDDRLFVRNSLSYTDGYREVRRLGRDPATKLDRYDIEEQGSTTRWDISVEYQLFSTPSEYGSPYIRTDVINVLDSKNVISAESGVQLFGIGRQYWLELGYRF